MGNKDIYSVEKIADDTYKIDECGRDICYLLLGSEKALLIDCSIGTGDIKGLVKELTDLPVTVAATHAHGDHTGAGYQFGEVWVHKSECIPIFRVTNSRYTRKKLISNHMKKNGITEKNIKGRIWNCKWLPFEDGKTFDLGGRTVTAHHTPGHSVGSVVYTDDKHKLMFTGDNTCPFLLMKLPYTVSLEEWLKGAEETLELSKTYTPWCAHGDGKQSTKQIEKTISLVREIIEKYPENTSSHEKIKYPKEPQGCCVVFDSAKVHKKQK
ncbi:MAG: MBL fold metallo-hydrolase [Acutalibacteraceae bacterium]